ncbi:LysR family transcriptional regulator [Xylophilus rhododendri]|uniref:LysR family transcriptional regulator n=1 Tax=Xylophilus rhododendri TaxID=2697032 RepID=A0A857J6A4_9BURK|nr:LysR family transcriptional regulator [Xylophilus rhododendri]QHI98552.1 LysR family transcriptional regulator [Xylophilus rhododendri]
MKLENFEALDAILRCGSFAVAARELQLTPSAISMRMKQLELYVGRPLFDRSGAQPRPMPLAEEIAALARPMLGGLKALRKGNGLAVEGTLRIGVIEQMQPLLLPGMVRTLRERHPRLQLLLSRGSSTQLTASVKAGEIDAGLVGRQADEGAASHLRWDDLLRLELVLIAPPESTEATPAALFQRYEWIRYDRQTATGAVAARYVAGQVGDIRGTLEAGSPAAIVAMVSAGLGVSVLQVADPALLKAHPVRVLPLGADAPFVQVSLVSRKLDGDSRALEALREAMHQALG